MPKSSLKKDSICIIADIVKEIPGGNSLRVNLIPRVKLKLAYYDVQYSTLAIKLLVLLT